MGCTASKGVNVAGSEYHKKKGSVDTVSTVALSAKGSDRGTASPIAQKLARQKWTVNRGYSSGASSYGSNEDDEIESADGFDPKSIPRPSGFSTRNISEASRLSDLREEFSTCELAKSVVRIETPFDTPIEEIYDGVFTGKVLGTGVSGTVRMITHRVTGINYAVKCLDLSLINTAESLLQLRNEIFIMCQLDHPNVMRIEEVYESNHEIYMVQEICYGGDLFDRLDAQPDYHYTEAQCAKLVKQMLSSIRYLHSKGIIHRDLKLENFLFSTPGEESDLKLIDFGLSKHFEVGEHLSEKVGTPYTVAPEILKGSYDEKSDMWSLGVITFLLLCGETPFGGLDGENLQIVKRNIMRAEVLFEPKEKWALVSDEGKEFVKSLLNLDATKRPTAKEAQRCSWIQEWAKKDSKEGNRLSRETVEALINFKESSEMQKLLSEVLSFTLLPEQIVDLRKEFEKLDSHGDGEITLGSLKRILILNAEVGALGALTENEVEEIFDSIKLPVRKAETTIRWHEFLAASLSQAKVDDRNLRLAFDRLDTQRKGFITFDDLSDILGNTTDLEALEKIWEESLLELNSRLDRITLDDFKKIMKGRPKEGMTALLRSSPGLVPTLSDPDIIPSLSGFSLGLPLVDEEENEGETLELSLQAEDGVRESAEPVGDCVFVHPDVEASETEAGVTIDGSENPPEDVSMRWSALDRTALSSDGPRLTASLSPLSVSEPINHRAYSASASMFSPLAANRHIYRQTLIRHSVVDTTRQEVEERLRDMRNSKTNAGLSMKRGTLFRGRSSD